MIAFTLALAFAQHALASPVGQLAPGKLLVAAPDLRDADFARSIVLIVQVDRQAAAGLMLNRPSNIRVEEVFPSIKGRSAAVYAGGPIRLGVNTLIQTETQPKDGTLLVQHVYLMADKSSQRKALATAAHSAVRVYVGYCGWSTQQLLNEIASGFWRVISGDAALIFDPDPVSSWSRIVRK